MIGFICTITEDPTDRDFMISLYQKYNRLLFFAARKLVSDLSTQEDIVQEALTKLIPKVSLLRTMQQPVLTNYIVTTVRNTAINYLKKQKRLKEHEFSFNDATIDEMDLQSSSLDELMLRLEQRSDFISLWPQLSEADRFLLEGRYILGHTDAELASQLGCKASSIRMMLTRARRRALSILQKGGAPLHDT